MEKIKFNYGSAYEFIQDVTRKDGKDWNNGCGDKSLTNGFDFCQSHDWADSVEQAYTGVDMVRVEEIREAVLEEIMSPKQAIKMDVVGDYVDVGLYLTGEPECMGAFVSVPKPVKMLHIAINVCEAGFVDSAFLKKKAAVVAAAVDKMELDATHRVKISVCMVNRIDGNKKVEVIEIVVKDYDQAMNVAEITGSLAVGFYRRLLFGWLEKYSPICTTAGYGSVNQWDEVKDINKALGILGEDEGTTVMLIENSNVSNEFTSKLQDAESIEEMSECANLLIKKANK
jgi:hypothetical protein